MSEQEQGQQRPAISEVNEGSAFRVPAAVRASLHNGGLILFHTDSGILYSTGSTGAAIWEILARGGNEAQAAEALRLRFGASGDEAGADTVSFISKLESGGFLIRGAGSARRPLLWWVAKAMWECLRYDALHAVFGFRAVRRSLESTPVTGLRGESGAEEAVSRAVEWAQTLYFRPLRCLTRSVVSARLLRQQGVPAEVVVGYAPAPFSSHAWVEVAGRALNGASPYRASMTVLDRF